MSLAKKVARKVDIEVEREVAAVAEVHRNQLVSAEGTETPRTNAFRFTIRETRERFSLSKAFLPAVAAERLRTQSVDDAMATLATQVATSLKAAQEQAAVELDKGVAAAVGKNPSFCCTSLPLLGVSTWMERGRQQNHSLAGGQVAAAVAREKAAAEAVMLRQVLETKAAESMLRQVPQPGLKR